MLLYRPGTGALRRMPDALSRNPVARDALNLARIGDWTKQRHIIRGVQESFAEEFQADEPEAYKFDISELGEPTTYKAFFEGRVKLKEPTQLCIDFV